MTRLDILNSRINGRTALISLTSAVIGLVIALLGGVVPLVRDVSDRDGVIAKRDQKIDSLGQQLKSSEATLGSRQETIDALRKENTELRAALPYTVTPENAHKIRSAATVVLAKGGDTLDLNSSLPNFRSAGYPWKDTLAYDGESLILAYNTSVRTLPSGVATYETCEATTGWKKSTSLDPHTLSVPSTCLRLDSNRYVAIQVRRYDEKSADLTITVWQ